MTRSLLVVGLLVSCVGCGRISTPVGNVHHRSCPQQDEHNAPSTYPATRTVLVPGRPIAALVCRYWGSDDLGRSGTLAGQRYVANTAKVVSFALKLDALRPPRLPLGRLNCDEVLGGRSVVFLFQYRSAPDDLVRIVREGCIPVSNGHRQAGRFALGRLDLGEHWLDEGLL